MMTKKPISYYLTLAILIFHILLTLHGFYVMFGEYSGWTIFHVRPILQLVFTLAWLGIFLKKRWSFFLYLSLTLYELAASFFFRQYEFGNVLGDIFFPVDLIFIGMMLLMYKQHFNDREITSTAD
jgi:hypothetical protein